MLIAKPGQSIKRQAGCWVVAAQFTRLDFHLITGILQRAQGAARSLVANHEEPTLPHVGLFLPMYPPNVGVRTGTSTVGMLVLDRQ